MDRPDGMVFGGMNVWPVSGRALNGSPLSHMWQPAHIDGRTVVILRRRASIFSGYVVVESGLLMHTGEELLLVTKGGDRIISDDELQAFQPVTPQNRILECRGFDFFVVRGSDA
jgi:hypothetical protein